MTNARLGKTPAKRWAVIAILTTGVVLLIPRLAGMGHVWQAIRHAYPSYLVAGLIFEGISLCSEAYLVHHVLLAFGPAVNFADVLQVLLAAMFASFLIPSVGLSGLAVRTRFFGERGHRFEASFASIALETIGLGLALCLILGLTLPAWMQLTAQTPAWRLGTALLFVLSLAGSAGTLALMRNPRAILRLRAPLQALVGAMQQTVRWTRHPSFNAHAIEERFGALVRALRRLTITAKLHIVLASLGRALGEALCLHMALWAVGSPAPLSTILAAWVLSSFLGFMSSSPGGLLVTEGSLAAVLARQGVPLPAAVAGTLIYRLFAFWLPRLAGLLSLVRLQKRSPQSLW